MVLPPSTRSTSSTPVGAATPRPIDVRVPADFSSATFFLAACAGLMVLSQARDWFHEGHRVWLVTVIETWGSAPRPVGALVVIRDDGQVVGSVSGGCVEDDLIEKVRAGDVAKDKPELITYRHGPHARVSCTECHIGSGATWFVKAKLSGTYQLYATTFNKYPRPIPTPIENLRPARETWDSPRRKPCSAVRESHFSSAGREAH